MHPSRAGGRVANEGARIAQAAGLDAEPVGVETTRPVWETIVELADRHDAATIVMGSRGLTGLRSMLLGSVSSAVVHHADRPTTDHPATRCRCVGPPAMLEGIRRACARLRPDR